MAKTVWHWTAIVGLCLATIFAFQNCGPANLSVSQPAGSSTGGEGAPSDANVIAPTPTPVPTPSGPIAIVGCQASASRAGAECANAYDGNKLTIWNAGTNQAWIELDLGTIQTVSKIILYVTQSPVGNTTHTIYYGTAQAPGVQLHTFAQYTDDTSILTWSGPTIQARYLRIQTTQNPSWTAWREIEVFH